MDFFEAQDRARSKTRALVALFALATLATAAAIYFAVTLILELSDGSAYLDLWDGRRAAWILVLTIGIATSCSTWKAAKLSHGGSSVAEMLGGRRAPPQSTDPQLQRLRNVVEEMAIAAGCRVPEVFVLPAEKGINAFAAGYTLDNAAIAVSQGALDELDREELQGVVAHEFSHILNGDMRLNTRLVSVIFGILAIAVLGRFALSGFARRSAFSSSRRRSSKGGAGIVVVLLIAVAVMIIGYIGVLFGRLIQSAVSRQREYLADAAAVQFTRNPSGISNALRKIGHAGGGSRVAHPDAEEVAHMLFAQGLRSAFATHPPLEKRIAAIDPAGVHAKPIKPRAPKPDPKADEAGKRERGDFVSSIGLQPIFAAAAAADLLARLPQRAADSARDPGRAFSTLGACLDPDSVALAGRRLSPEERFALVELALAALKHLPEGEAQRGIADLQTRALADGAISIDEQCILLAARRNLADWHRNANGRLVLFPKARADIEVALSAIALVDAPSESAARGAFEQCQVSFRGFAATLKPDFEAARDPARVNAAIERIGVSIFNARKAVVDAASRIASSDETLSPREQTLIRSLCLALGVPLPR